MDNSVLQLKHGNSVARDGREGKTKHRKEKNNGKNIKKKNKKQKRNRMKEEGARVSLPFC
ncbi:MAG: hypothetical protein HA492_00430 [Candidatus Verstraetearchaeota archaeon]|nr:hypothetical protein [Candidatus Verstraetearchaeota archaeon]